MLQPYIARGRASEWYRGTADAVLAEHRRSSAESPGDTVLVLAGDHIYKMDYQPFIQPHRRNRADVTVAVKRVPIGEAHRFGILALDDDDEVTEWQEKPKQPKSDLASLGIYVFSKRALLAWLDDDRAPTSGAMSSRPCSTAARASSATGSMATGRTSARSRATGRRRWTCSRSIPALDLYDKDWVIHTRSEERAPARIGPTASVHRSLISHGCLIAGTVERSVLSPGVRVDPGAVVRDSIIMFDSGHPRRRGRRPGHPRQGGLRSDPTPSSAWAPTTTRPTARSPAGSTPASRSSASAPSSPPACASAATSRSPRRARQADFGTRNNPLGRHGRSQGRRAAGQGRRSQAARRRADPRAISRSHFGVR